MDRNLYLSGLSFQNDRCLITNFHLPESTLVMLVSALAGKENIMHAYETAVQEKYRFFSFGDAMINHINVTQIIISINYLVMSK